MVSPFSIAALLVVPLVLWFFWRRKAPIVQGIVIANLLVFILMLASGLVAGSPFGHIGGSPFLNELAYRPSEGALGLWKVLPTTFLHADLLHVLSNMLILLMVGLPFEERVGRGRFLAIYVFSAVTAVLIHVFWTYATQGAEGLTLPIVGASGAVFGILGAFATGYPHDRITMWVVFLILPRVPVIIAALVLVLLELLVLGTGGSGGVANAAHLGGALGGAFIMLLLKPRIGTSGSAAAATLDVAALEARATEPRQKAMIARLKENLDHPETRRAWFEELGRTMRCSECGQPFNEIREPRLKCPAGHEEGFHVR